MCAGTDRPQQIRMFPHPIAVAPNVDDGAVVQQPVDAGRRHHLVPEDGAPLLEAFVGGQHGRGVFVAGIDELEAQHRPVPTDGQIADLIDDEERGITQHPEAARELPGGFSLFQRLDEGDQGTVVDPSPVLRRGDREADGQVGLAPPRAARGR